MPTENGLQRSLVSSIMRSLLPPFISEPKAGDQINGISIGHWANPGLAHLRAIKNQHPKRAPISLRITFRPSSSPFPHIKTYSHLALNELDVFFNFSSISRTNPNWIASQPANQPMPHDSLSHIKCISQCECVNFCGLLWVASWSAKRACHIAMQHVCVTFATSFAIHA